MGVYLSTPCMDLSYEEGKGNGVHFFVGEMQGWRKNMEDAHIAYDDLTTVSQIYSPQPLSIFGVFDGHGGKEVAKFAQDRFAAEFVALTEFKEGKYEEALRRAFHRIDELLEDPQFDPILEKYRQIPNPSDKDRRSGSSRITETMPYKVNAAAPPPNPTTASTSTSGDASNSSSNSNSISTDQAMEMLKQLLVNESSSNNTPATTATTGDKNNNESAAPIAGVPSNRSPGNVPTPLSTIVAPPVPAATATAPTMTCTLKDHRVNAGCTAVVAFRMGNTLYVANAGDSRAVLCRGDRQALPLSEDHKPNQPRELGRIHAAGGFVTQIGRVNGNLNLSRSLGDLKYKQVQGVSKENQIISGEPDVSVTTLLPDDRFIIIACDGVWDCMDCQQACNFVSERLDHNISLKDIVDQALKRCIADDPRKSGGIGGDNMTFMIILLETPSATGSTTGSIDNGSASAATPEMSTDTA